MTIATERATLRSADALLGCVRARARLAVAWMENLWRDGEGSIEQGAAITPGEVRRILADPDELTRRQAHFLGEHDARHLLESVRQGDDELASNGYWNRIIATFQLSRRERDLLSLAVAVELDPRIARVLAYLADDTRVLRPTASLTWLLFGSEDGGGTGGGLRMSSLMRWRLAHPVGPELAWQTTAGWQADEAIVESVAAETWKDSSLNEFVALVEPEEALHFPCAYPQLLDELLQLHDDEPLDVVISGPEGSGRQTLAAQYAAAKKKSLLVVRTLDLLAAYGNQTIDALVRAARLARATNSLIYWRDADKIAVTDWREVRRLSGFSFRALEKPFASASRNIALKHLPLQQRLAVWSHYSPDTAPAIVRIQRLTPAEVRATAERGSAATGEAALRQLQPTQADLLQSLSLPYTWDDIVLTPGVRDVLKAFEDQVRLRWEVYEDWGFARLTHLGHGISALFGGPSGTGKTMAAQVLARSLGLALYRVDLAGVVNKYIGETEKRLRDVFDVCERSGALLFFDEADALFGNRMPVKDSHDRFANIEIDYLLQRIEQFDGVAILATNRKNDLDSAFLRRLRFVIDFLTPSKSERRLLWEKALPAVTPGGERIVDRIDFDALASDMEITGAQIKAIALNAAFLARADHSTIGMKQILLAAQREYAKQALVLPQPFERAVRTEGGRANG